MVEGLSVTARMFSFFFSKICDFWTCMEEWMDGITLRQGWMMPHLTSWLYNISLVQPGALINIPHFISLKGIHCIPWRAGVSGLTLSIWSHNAFTMHGGALPMPSFGKQKDAYPASDNEFRTKFWMSWQREASSLSMYLTEHVPLKSNQGKCSQC